MSYVAIGLEEGAVPVVGGHRALQETGGFYMELTILDSVRPDMRVAQEEIFGPVLAAIAFERTEEAISIANGTRFGLGAAVWTRDLSRAHLTARALRAVRCG